MSVVLAMALAVVAQTGGAEAQTPPPAPERVELVGKIREVGGGIRGEAQALIVLDDKSDRVLHGLTEKDDDELKRLAGVRVKVFGVANDPLMPRGNHVRVDRYEIVDVGGGAVPRIGHIAELQIDGKPRLIFVDSDGKADVLPASWVKKMAKHVGSKMWVVARSERGAAELVPARFGILRPGAKAGPGDDLPTEPNDKP